jgi:hypothetical protein
MQSEQIDKLAAALAKAQGVITNAVTDKENPAFKRAGTNGTKYASLAAVINSLREPLSANGLAISQMPLVRESGMVLRTTLMHSSGQWICGEYPLPLTARPQEMGSALTYARRYSLASMICNAVDEDDDGNGAEEHGHRTDSSGRAPPRPAPVAIQPAKSPSGDAPKALRVPMKDGKHDWIKFGQELIAEASSGDADAWLSANQTATDTMRQEAPKAYDRMVAAIMQKEAAQ